MLFIVKKRTELNQSSIVINNSQLFSIRYFWKSFLWLSNLDLILMIRTQIVHIKEVIF